MTVKSVQIRLMVSHGEEMTSPPVHQRALRGMGYAPEGSEIFPELTRGAYSRCSPKCASCCGARA